MGKPRQKLLLRQLKQAKLNEQDVSPEVTKFINLVDNTYRIQTRETKLHNRAMELSSKELMIKNRKLEAAAKFSKDFSYIVAHDLKQPIRTISSFSKLLKVQTEETLSDKSKYYLDFILQGVDRMDTYLKDLMDYLVLDTQEKLVKVEIDLNHIVSKVCDDLQTQIKEANAQINILNPLPRIKTYSSNFDQIFMNLINNSIKFRQDNIAPIINISHLIDSDQLVISVTDNGIGVEPQYAEQIFMIFQRLDAKKSGTGIGLAICKKIMQFNDGLIEVDTQYTQGAKFDIRIPVSLISNTI